MNACRRSGSARDRKSTRLNSSHTVNSYAVFCLKKKKKDSNSVIVKKINCNNINVNVNGLELIALPAALNSLLTGEAQATNEVFFFNDTETTDIYTLSLHDALPI